MPRCRLNIRIFKYISLIPINYLSILIILIFLLKLHLVAPMDMTMDKILRLIFFQQIIKALKTLMRFVRSVTYSRCRRMCILRHCRDRAHGSVRARRSGCGAPSCPLQPHSALRLPQPGFSSIFLIFLIFLPYMSVRSSCLY